MQYSIHIKIISTVTIIINKQRMGRMFKIYTRVNFIKKPHYRFAVPMLHIPSLEKTNSFTSNGHSVFFCTLRETAQGKDSRVSSDHVSRTKVQVDYKQNWFRVCTDIAPFVW
jgi:hypothetical protein